MTWKWGGWSMEWDEWYMEWSEVWMNEWNGVWMDKWMEWIWNEIDHKYNGSELMIL